MFAIFTQVPVTQHDSFSHVFRKQTHRLHNCGPITSCDAWLHTTTSRTTFAVSANNQITNDTETNFWEEKYFRTTVLENSVVTELAVNKTSIQVILTLRRIWKEYVLFIDSEMSHSESWCRHTFSGWTLTVWWNWIELKYLSSQRGPQVVL
jgi:hypothetical protein